MTDNNSKGDKYGIKNPRQKRKSKFIPGIL